MKREILAFSVALTVSLTGGSRAATSVILDGTFQDPIGTGSNLTPWSDWTNAGITRAPAPAGIPGDYASLPVGADLFQQFSSLANGTYVLSFLVENPSSSPVELVFATQQGGGTFIDTLFQLGTAEEILAPVSNQFERITLTFTIDNPPFIPDELYFSNSYDAPIGPISNSINPAGTIVNIADVTLYAVPEPATWVTMLIGFAGLGAAMRSRRKPAPPAVT
jgi:PEP-CTERM motif